MLRRFAIMLFAAVPFSALAAAENYTLDPYHTFPNFTVDHLGLSTMYGRFGKTSGKFSMDRGAKSGSVELVIDTASVDTGDNDKGTRARSRNEHLRSVDFFNAAEFPQMTFKSTKVTFNGDNPATVEGDLTLLGVTKPLSLTLERFKCGTNPGNKKDRCGGNATGKLKRSDFGMKTGIPAVSDEITLLIEFEGDKD